jgi:hypothetical protein
MKKINEGEELWNKIRGKHIGLLARHKITGEKLQKIHVDYGKIYYKVKGVRDAAKEIRTIDDTGKATSKILLNKIEPVAEYLAEYIARQVKYLSTKEIADFSNTVNNDFVARMELANRTIHVKHYTNNEAIELLQPLDKEIDELLIFLTDYEKNVDESFLELETFIKENDFTEN